jgi:CheY-like chemotaxis protein
MARKAARPKCIMIVEDDASSREALAGILNHVGYKSIEAENSTEAVEHLYSGVLPDLILVDLKLPGKSGILLINELKLNPLFSKIPVIVVTGMLREFDPPKEVVAVFEKPLENEKLMKKIAEVLKK